MRKLLAVLLITALIAASPALAQPNNTAAILHQTIAAVCPINGVAGPYTATDNVPNANPAKDGSLWVINYADSATDPQKTAAVNTLAAFDPHGPQATGQTTYNAAIAAGLTLNWTSTTALSGTYAIDPVTMGALTTEYNSLNANGVFPSGTAIKPWPDITGAKHLFSPPNFKLFAPALIKYVSQLGEALTNSLAGQVVTWPPSTVSINALAAAEATTKKPPKKKR